MHMLDHTRVAIDVNGLELAALKKLSLVSHALARKLSDFRAREEQTTLAMTLDEVIRRIELAAATGTRA
jgi:hypothetical protein